MGLVKTVRLNIITDPGTAKEKIDAISAKADELARKNPEIKVKIDTAAATLKLQVLKHELKDTTTQTESLGNRADQLGKTLEANTPAWTGFAAAGAAIGPALLPVLATVTAGVLGIGAAVVAGGGALGLFGIVAKSQITDMQKAQQSITALDKAEASATGSTRQADIKKLAAANRDFASTYGPAWAGLQKLDAAWKAFKTAGGGAVNTVLAQGMNALSSALPHLTPLLLLGAHAASEFIGLFQGWVDRGGLDRLVKGLVTIGGPALKGFADIFVHLGQALSAFAPHLAGISGSVVSTLDGWSAALARWANSKGGGVMTGFLSSVQQMAPQVGKLLLNLVQVIPQLTRGLLPLAPLSIAFSTALSGLIAKVPPRVITGLALAFIGLWASIKLVAGAELIFKGFSAAVAIWTGITKVAAAAQFLLDSALDANPIGLVIIAIAALVAGLIIAYKNSATFRAIVTDAFHAVEAAAEFAFNWVKHNWPLILAILTGPIGLLVLFVTRNFDRIKTFVGNVIHDIIGFFLGLVIRFLDGVKTITDALGHLPGPLGAPFRAASRAIQDTIDHVQSLKDHVAGLKGKTINIGVFGTGKYGVTGPGSTGNVLPGGHRLHAARGLYINSGRAGVDDQIIAAQKGELVVPVPMVNAGLVDHLKGRIPGFAAGGIVGSYAGSVQGAGPWITRNVAATTRMLEDAVAAGTLKAMNAASAAASTFKGKFGSGVAQWRGDVIKVLAMLGLPSTLAGNVLYQMQTESGGNPNAINRTDSNAAAGDPSRGLLQTIMTTFEEWRSFSLPDNIYNPMANIFAAVNYAEHRYGRTLMSGGMGMGSGHGYDQGGFLPTGWSMAYNGTGRPEPVGPTARGGNTYNITVNMPFGSTKADVESGIVRVLDDLNRQHRLPVPL